MYDLFCHNFYTLTIFILLDYTFPYCIKHNLYQIPSQTYQKQTFAYSY